jgi:hypothetical protein
LLAHAFSLFVVAVAGGCLLGVAKIDMISINATNETTRLEDYLQLKMIRSNGRLALLPPVFCMFASSIECNQRGRTGDIDAARQLK